MSITDQNARQAAAIASSFAGSKFIAERTAIPSDLMQARFGDAFRLNDGKVVAYDQSGNLLFSRTNPGSPAAFEEALELLIEAHPNRDRILVGGASAGGGGVGRSLNRAAFDALAPGDRHAHIKAGGKVVD